MKIYDISQEVFASEVYPGDPVPERQILSRMEDGDLYNLTAFRMCAHNGTHVDAPAHFFKDGKGIDAIAMEHFVGLCYVAEWEGELTAEGVITILEKIRAVNAQSAKRILLKGNVVVTEEAAAVFAEAGLLLLGNESQTVGPKEAPMAVHLTLLGAEVVLLEGIRLQDVVEGVYFISAAPLNLGGADGAPCRAILIEPEEMLHEAGRVGYGFF